MTLLNPSVDVVVTLLTTLGIYWVISSNKTARLLVSGKPQTTGVLLYEMIAGIDPFSDDDPMMVYQKILKGKVKFPSGFDS